MPAEAERVVFDCVVYAQAIINPDGSAGACLDLCRKGALSLCVSDYVLGEIRELPGKLTPRLQITDAKIEQLVADVLSFSRRVGSVPDVYVLQRDADDSHYINLALAAHAKLITSRDRDLLDLMDSARPESIEFQRRFADLRILTPEQLLDHVRVGRSSTAKEG